MVDLKVICDAHEELRHMFEAIERIGEGNPVTVYTLQEYKEVVSEIIVDWREVLNTATDMGIRMKKKLEENKRIIGDKDADRY